MPYCAFSVRDSVACPSPNFSFAKEKGRRLLLNTKKGMIMPIMDADDLDFNELQLQGPAVDKYKDIEEENEYRKYNGGELLEKYKESKKTAEICVEGIISITNIK